MRPTDSRCLPVGVLRLSGIVALVCALCGPVSPALHAQTAEPAPPRVLEAVLEAGPASGASESRPVTLRYGLHRGGVDSIPLAGLEFFGRRVEGVTAEDGQGRSLEVRLGPTASGGLAGAVILPAGAGDVAQARLSLVLRYRVSGPGVSTGAGTVTGTVRAAVTGPARAASGSSTTPGSDFDAVIPVIRVDWPPEASREALFTARVSLPPDWSVVEVFPMVPREVAERDGERVHALSLPVVPSMVRLRGRVGDPPVLTLGRWVDLGVLSVILAAGLLGWRGLRRPRAGKGRP